MTANFNYSYSTVISISVSLTLYDVITLKKQNTYTFIKAFTEDFFKIV